MKKNILLLFLFLYLISLTFGCGSGKVKLSGHVTFSDDQSPLEKGVVIFENGTYAARGAIDTNGKYIIGSESQRDGLPPGTYKVYITDSEHIIPAVPPAFPKLEPVIHKKYTNAVSTPLSLEVNTSTKKFDIQVEHAEKSTIK
ncbi:MAG: carboxypeptidase-like regulatory domain-containing protein [Planctomycetaceae bacterium]|jgi:hypothetical protein|nr:carboxypeptidase-like regulatory domain-containing protein [Planctomycetaceae bacterium]